jgi:hypothetical protein
MGGRGLWVWERGEWAARKRAGKIVGDHHKSTTGQHAAQARRLVPRACCCRGVARSSPEPRWPGPSFQALMPRRRDLAPAAGSTGRRLAAAWRSIQRFRHCGPKVVTSVLVRSDDALFSLPDVRAYHLSLSHCNQRVNKIIRNRALLVSKWSRTLNPLTIQ